MKTYKQLMTYGAAVCLLLGQAREGLAQRRPNPHFVPYSSVSFGGGSSHYYGDLAGYKQFIKATYIMPRWNLGIGYTRQFTPHFAARAAFTWARISGDDYTFNKSNIQDNIVAYARNLHFRNDLKEFALTGLYNFVADGRNSGVRAKFTPYLFGGVALLAHSPEARTPAEPDNREYEARKWVKLQPLHTEGQGQPGYEKPYSLVTVAIPVGVGARYRLSEDFTVGFEIGFRYTFSDYLDDVGGPYASPDALQGLSTLMANRRLEQNDARVNVNRYDALKALFDSNPGLQPAISDALTTNPVRGSSSQIVGGFLKDAYLLTSITIHYIIPAKIKCPPIK